VWTRIYQKDRKVFSWAELGTSAFDVALGARAQMVLNLGGKANELMATTTAAETSYYYDSFMVPMLICLLKEEKLTPNILSLL